MKIKIISVSLALLYRIRANHRKNVKLVTNKIFSEKLYPLTVMHKFYKKKKKKKKKKKTKL